MIFTYVCTLPQNICFLLGSKIDDVHVYIFMECVQYCLKLYLCIHVFPKGVGNPEDHIDT